VQGRGTGYSHKSSQQVTMPPELAEMPGFRVFSACLSYAPFAAPAYLLLVQISLTALSAPASCSETNNLRFSRSIQ